MAVITLDGTIETLGREVGPDTVIWYPMGSRHGLRNVGDRPAQYVVFEFHGANLGSRLSLRRARHRAKRLLHLPGRVARRLRRQLTRPPSIG